MKGGKGSGSKEVKSEDAGLIDRLSNKVREQAKQLSHLQQELDIAGLRINNFPIHTYIYYCIIALNEK